MGMVRFWEDPSLSWWRDGRLPDGPLPGSGGEREEGGREREREEGGREREREEGGRERELCPSCKGSNATGRAPTP